MSLTAIVARVKKAHDVRIVAYPEAGRRGYVNMEKIVAMKQGSGSGTRALTMFKRLLKEDGYRGISISVLPLNGFRTTTADDVDRLVGWYLKNGFRITRKSPIIQMEIKL